MEITTENTWVAIRRWMVGADCTWLLLCVNSKWEATLSPRTGIRSTMWTSWKKFEVVAKERCGLVFSLIYFYSVRKLLPILLRHTYRTIFAYQELLTALCKMWPVFAKRFTKRTSLKKGQPGPGPVTKVQDPPLTLAGWYWTYWSTGRIGKENPSCTTRIRRGLSHTRVQAGLSSPVFGVMGREVFDRHGIPGKLDFYDDKRAPRHIDILEVLTEEGML